MENKEIRTIEKLLSPIRVKIVSFGFSLTAPLPIPATVLPCASSESCARSCTLARCSRSCPTIASNSTFGIEVPLPSQTRSPLRKLIHCPLRATSARGASCKVITL